MECLLTSHSSEGVNQIERDPPGYHAMEYRHLPNNPPPGYDGKSWIDQRPSYFHFADFGNKSAGVSPPLCL